MAYLSRGARRTSDIIVRAGASLGSRLLLLAATGLVAALSSSSVGADFPFPGPGAAAPYEYQNYMFITPAQYPPSDLGGDAWKYYSGDSCALDGPGPLSIPPGPNVNCDPAVSANPQELFGVTGASIDKSWEKTTGRPDVVIAVHDSGIKWNDGGFLVDLNNKTWLNRGELPVPDWGSPHPNDPYDRNGDGVFNIKDYCSNPQEPNDCGGIGDSNVRGAAASDDTDYNNNDWIDPEDLIFKFSDGVDDDGNGYVDDFVGWDTFEDDNDPFDEVQYGHGTGEARDSTAEVNSGGDAGVCPNCMVMHMRVGDSFIADTNDFAQGMVYATDNGASVIQSALGTLNNSRFAQEAITHAYRRGVVLIASAADESAGHHNQPSVLEHGVVVNSIGEPELPTYEPKSYLDFRGCTNYGAYITAAVPSNSCSSEATGRTSGMAGLIYSAAKNQVALGNIADYGTLDGSGGVTAGRGVSAEEVDQLIATTADDLNFLTPVDYTARTGFPEPTERYPAGAGWDPFFGYGRVNANRMVSAIGQNKIPPEADITSPVWFATIDPESGPVQIQGTVASRRSAKYSYSVKWAVWSWRSTNAAPTYVTTGVTIPAGQGDDQTAPINGLLASISSTQIAAALGAVNGPVGAVDGPAVDPATGRGDHENLQYPDKFGVIVQLEVTAKNAAGVALMDIDGEPLTGIGTKNFNFHQDPALFPGYPKDLQGDGAASPRFADLDNDGQDELIVATSNGEVHAYEAAGGEVPGWPVYTCDSNYNYGAPAYQSSEITKAPDGKMHAAVLRSATIGDINRDGDLEVAVGDFQGCLSIFDRHGDLMPGFPVGPNPYYSSVQRADREAGYYAANPALVPGDYRGPGALPNAPDFVPDMVNRKNKMNRTIWWFVAAPSLGNIDPSDEDLEIIAGNGDRHIYAFKSNGSPVPGWPVLMRDPAKLDATDGIDPITHRLDEDDRPPGTQCNQDFNDLDGDAIPDCFDPDDDNDGVCDVGGPFPSGTPGTPPGGCVLAPSAMDNCPSVPNPDQTDTDGDGQGDLCHSDVFNGAKVVVSPAIGDINGDGTLEVIATVNEQYAEPVNSDDDSVATVAQQADLTSPGNQRVYALFADGTAHGVGPPGGSHPNPNAYLPGWPARLAVITTELLPVVGDGPDGAPVLGNVNGGGDLEIGIFGTAGPGYILNTNGDSIFGQDAQGRDRTLLLEANGSGSNSADSPSVPAVGGAILTDLQGTGQLVFAAPAAGLGKVVDVALAEDQQLSDNHLSVWELGGTRSQIPAFPREVNDLQFLSTPASADITGDGLEELLNGSAYSDLHAFNVAGAEPGLTTLAPNGWPKFTGGWTVGPSAVGDFDGDGQRDIAHSIREGRLFVWNGNGAGVCDPASWPEFGHDGWNTNNYHTDAQRPRTITNLAAGGSGFQWTAPGDDGTCGQASQYQMRRSTSPITNANFAQAEVVPGSPLPAMPGAAQSMPIPGARKSYFYAIRTIDDAGNPSAVSNVLLIDGPDEDNDGVADIDELNCGGNHLDPNRRPERIDADFAGVDDDGDTQIDEPLAPATYPFDCDGDGFSGNAENHLYNPTTLGNQDACGSNSFPATDSASPIGWPLDLRGETSFSANKVNVVDLGSFTNPVRRINTDVGTTPGDRRWDLVAGGGILAADINVVDTATLISGLAGYPPMLKGNRAFNSNCPWSP